MSAPLTPDALAALASLRDALADVLPPAAEFGIGMKRIAGEYQDQLALIVYLPEKLPADAVPEGQLVPSRWAEMPTDVVQSAPEQIALVNDSAFENPLRGGIEIGRVDPLGGILGQEHAGTLGCMVDRRGDSLRLLLTAAHVTPDGSDVAQPAAGGVIGRGCDTAPDHGRDPPAGLGDVHVSVGCSPTRAIRDRRLAAPTDCPVYRSSTRTHCSKDRRQPWQGELLRERTAWS